MYRITNENDIPNLLKYHRAKDMVNIKRFFPDLSPVDDLAVILDEEDYKKHKNEIKELKNMRNGNPTTEPCMKSIPVRDINEDPLEVLKEIKKENENGVLILFHLNTEPTERYERIAGISVGVSLGNMVYIDAVGKGFDGREVLKGICCHERYAISWEDIRTVNIDNFKTFNTFLIDQEKYKETRKERIHYLESCGIKKEVLEENIPKEYEPIPDFIWLDIIRNVIKPLEEEEEFLRESGFQEFNLSGHTEGNHFAPWQMADDSRM